MNIIQNLTSSVIAAATRACQTGQMDWPVDAVYAVKYQCYNWPTYDQREKVEFFKDAQEFQVWRSLMREFVRYEDNYFTLVQGYTWDWGPVEFDIESLCDEGRRAD